MLARQKTKWVIFSVLVSIILLSFFLVEKNTAHLPIQPIVFLSFLITAIIVAVWPISFGHQKYLIIQWLTVPLMLRYGLIFELLLYQFALIVYLWRVNEKFANLRLLPIYSFLYFFVPLITYMILNFAGLQVGQLTIYEVAFYAMLYQMIIVVLSYSIVTGIIKYLRLQPSFYIKKELLVIIFSIPVIIAIYYLISIIGPFATMPILMFYLLLSVLTKSLATSLLVNDYLNFVVKLSQKLSVSHSRQQALTLFMDNLMTINNVDEAYLIHDVDDRFELLSARTLEKNVQYVHEHTNYVADVYHYGEVIYLSKFRKWILMKSPFPFRHMETLIFIPLKRDEIVVAVLIVASKKRRAFKQYQIKLLDLLATNLALSLARIRFIEHTISKSERCALTNLYNYRYLDEQINDMTYKFDKGLINQLSLIMLDIDHFKSINDTYGHESGNVIIKAVAKQLDLLVDETMVLARYGGEEFVILMPDKGKEEALLLAEKIRNEIASTEYQVVAELDDKRADLSIYITLSIGVSSTPDDTSDIQRLLANADRALYLGAKRNGRNRVAAFCEGI